MFCPGFLPFFATPHTRLLLLQPSPVLQLQYSANTRVHVYVPMILEYHLFASIPPGGVLVSAAGTPIPPLAAACCGMATSRYFDEEADEAEAAEGGAAAAGGGASAAAPSSSSSAPPRVPRDDVLFKADARAAFAEMGV